MFLATSMFLATYYEHQAKDLRENAAVSFPCIFLCAYLFVLLRLHLGKYRPPVICAAITHRQWLASQNSKNRKHGGHLYEFAQAY
jgi:hypothetical protein